jgi:hypothetical protein
MAKSRKMALGLQAGKPLRPELITSPEKRMRIEIAVDALERWGYLVESALTRKRWISPLLSSVAFVPCAVVKASRRSFTFDEILSKYIAALPSFGKIWEALVGHAESSPPLFHFIFKLSANTFGWSQIGLRIPSIIG